MNYQNFFFLSVAIAMIITTVISIILCIIVIKKHFGSRRGSRIDRAIERQEEEIRELWLAKQELIKQVEALQLSYKLLLNANIPPENKLLLQITHLESFVKEKLESMQEQINESKD